MGILVFGSEAFLQAPFTQDHDLLRALLASTLPSMAGPSTMLGDAIGLSIKVFEQSEAEDRVLLLLTDGKDSGSKVPPGKAAEIAARKGLTIHCIAVGDSSSTGDTEIDLKVLDEIAGKTGGVSFMAGDREQLETVYRRIDELTPVEVETLSYRPTRPLFHWPLGAFLLAGMLYHAWVWARSAARRTGRSRGGLVRA